jgi:catechol 2,3-dioxygenase-like lactoylglutathione lyase family enzyme
MPQPLPKRFATGGRIHMGLAVANLQRSQEFYRQLFQQEPTKVRPHYARFEVADPPLNLALNEVGGPTGPNNPVAHFGIEVQSAQAVQDYAQRLRQAGLAIRTEERVTCCYAVQDKIWITDPDGNSWEVYVVLHDDGAHHQASFTAAHDCGAAAPQASP